VGVGVETEWKIGGTSGVRPPPPGTGERARLVGLGPAWELSFQVMVRASPAGATHFNIGEDPHRAADAKMTVFVRASVYV
jgi:hypothetical protein